MILKNFLCSKTTFRAIFRVERYLNFVSVPKKETGAIVTDGQLQRGGHETLHHRPTIPAKEIICKYYHLQNNDNQLHSFTECGLRAIEHLICNASQNLLQKTIVKQLLTYKVSRFKKKRNANIICSIYVLNLIPCLYRELFQFPQCLEVECFNFPLTLFESWVRFDLCVSIKTLLPTWHKIYIMQTCIRWLVYQLIIFVCLFCAIFSYNPVIFLKVMLSNTFISKTIYNALITETRHKWHKSSIRMFFSLIPMQDRTNLYFHCTAYLQKSCLKSHTLWKFINISSPCDGTRPLLYATLFGYKIICIARHLMGGINLLGQQRPCFIFNIEIILFPIWQQSAGIKSNLCGFSWIWIWSKTH